MRKHSARKWLHAILDLLPVILIPVFMIYSHRHSVAEDVPVADIQYKYQSNEVNSLDDLVPNNIYLWTQDIDINLLNYTGNDLSFSFYGGKSITTLYNGDIDEYTLSNINYFDTFYSIYFNTDGSYTLFIYGDFENDEYIALTGEIEDLWGFYNLVVSFNDYELDLLKDFLIDNPNNWNLPQYCPYNVVENFSIDYSDNVMDVFLKDFNFTIEKYFNFSNVFNLNDVYDWVVTNIFNGSAPLILYSVWNIIAYEFIMDLLFLLYGLFMFFIDTCTNLMDRFYGNLSGRR